MLEVSFHLETQFDPQLKKPSQPNIAADLGFKFYKALLNFRYNLI